MLLLDHDLVRSTYDVARLNERPRGRPGFTGDCAFVSGD
jgi:hypothetical protein